MMRKIKMLAIAGIMFCVAGCGFLFGGPEALIGRDGKPVMNPDGTPALVYKEGAIQKLTRVIAPIANMVPYGSAGAALLGIIATVGATVQTVRHRGKVKASDVVRLVDDLKPAVAEIRGDEHVGNLVAKWEPGSKFAKKIKAAFLKDRNGA